MGGGLIDEYMPFEDDVALVCNDEGKMLGLPLNRAIEGEDGKIMDVICGDFFICQASRTARSRESEKCPVTLSSKAYRRRFSPQYATWWLRPQPPRLTERRDSGREEKCKADS